MISRYPATPMDALTISRPMRAAVRIIHAWARMWGMWKRPSENAAGDFEEMTLMDKMYWGYKSKHPVMKSGRGMEFGGGLFAGGDELRSAGGLTLATPEDFAAEEHLTFAAVGDLIKADGLGHSAGLLYERIAPLLFAADISYANLESQLSPGEIAAYTFSDKEAPPLCLSPEQYRTLVHHRGQSFQVLHAACNHTFDAGYEGFQTTLAQLERDGVLPLGVNTALEQREQGRFIERKGIKIGFVSAAYGLNGKPVAAERNYTVNLVRFHRRGRDFRLPDIALLERQIAHCRRENCDIIIASLHWGYEYEFYPRPQQTELARFLAEAGVDVLIGHHPHVLQPVEFYRTQRDPERIAVLAYSLGNLTSSFSAPYLLLSGLLRLNLVRGTRNGRKEVYISGVRLVPVVQTEISNGSFPALRLEALHDLAGGSGREERELAAAVEPYTRPAFAKKKWT